jgi:hypothetical protein
MFEDPNEGEEGPEERPKDPVQQAREKADEFRMHAEIFAIFEGPRKFEAQLVPGLDPELAREVQRGIAKLEKTKEPDSPVLPPASAADAAALLAIPESRGLSTNDYHIHRRPGEVILIRWLEGEQVETFHERMQAHFDVAMKGYVEEERQANAWKQDPKTLAYLEALDAAQVKMADRYLRDVIRKHKVFVLSTLAADEMDILHLCDFVMGVPAAEVVGAASAPPDEPTERDRAWFFKLFSLRGKVEGVERMHFFTFLQKTEDTFEF